MSFLHLHRWQVVQSFDNGRGFVWPPMWTCPCGKLRDMQTLAEWGME